MSKRVRFISEGAIIAALYVILSLISAAFGLSGGVIQIRISEALCVLPLFTSAAIPGLFLGCLLTNVLTGCVIWDVIFGSIATLLGAIGTYLVKKHTKDEIGKYIALLPPIISNMVIVPLILVYCYHFEKAWWFIVLTVGIGEVISAGILGAFLYSSLKKTNIWK